LTPFYVDCKQYQTEEMRLLSDLLVVVVVSVFGAISLGLVKLFQRLRES